MPKLRLSNSRTRLGSCSIKRTRTWKGTLRTDFTISISSFYDFTESQLVDVMAHEMIHYSIGYTGLKDNSPHGIIFRGMMDNLNRKYGLHISVSTKSDNFARSQPAHLTMRLVLAARLADGKCLMSVVSPSSASKLESQIRHVDEIVWHQWIRTNIDYFREFPHVRTLRGRIVPKEKFEEIIGMVEKGK